MSQYAQEIGFASGTLIATPVFTTGIQTPMKFGILQDVDLSFSGELKELYGQNRFAVAIAPGKTKIELKAKFAQIQGALFNNLFFGGAQTATQTLFADSEPHTIASGAATAANSTQFIADQGVFYAATGQQLQAATTITAPGQYNQSGGVYAFSTGDNSQAVYLSYTYGSTSGSQITLINPKMGVGPQFSVVLSQMFDGRQHTWIFPQCQASKFSFPTKQDDFVIAEVDFMVAANAAGIVGTLNTAT